MGITQAGVITIDFSKVIPCSLRLQKALIMKDLELD